VPPAFFEHMVLDERWLQAVRDGRAPALGAFVEAVRQTGVRARRALDGGERALLSVESACPGEGKTLLAANLAAVTALDSDRQVLLVDGNLRRPLLSAWFGCDGAAGLSDVADGAAELDDAIRETGTPGLYVLPAGRRRGRPEALFQSGRFSEIATVLRKRFALIVLDLPDLRDHSEGMLAVPETDAVLMVCRLRATPKSEALSALSKTGGERPVVIVANGREQWIPAWLDRWL
jgi:Mrp family chromosome partitioning ATPase